jgi:tRNA-splicing ligase RtcB
MGDPGTMGAPTYVVEGRGNTDALASSSHGAGRQMSRAEAHDRIRVRDLASQMRGVTWDERRAAQLVDEAPAAYKDIGRVMKAQRALTRIVTRLRPVLNYKGR